MTGRARRAASGEATSGSSSGGLGRVLQRRIQQARLSIFLERLAPAVWPLLGVLGLFLAFALLELPSLLPLWLHSLILAGFVGAAGYAAWWGWRQLSWPGLDEAKRRLEQDSRIPHRPLTAWDDRLMAGGEDKDSVALWAQYRESLLAKIGSMKPGAPRATMAEADPLALRALVVVLLVVAVGFAGGDWSGRLLDAMTPRVATASVERPVGIDVWLNPPAYTGLPPQFLETPLDDAAVLSVPVGSTVLAQVQGVSEAPDLLVGETATAFESVAQDAYRASAVVTLPDATEVPGEEQAASEDQTPDQTGSDEQTTSTIAVRRGTSNLAAWPITVVPDLVPEVVFLSPPSNTERFVLRLEYGAQDDYGVDRVTAMIQRIDNPDVAPMELVLPLSQTEAKDLQNASYHDLTPHPWAGLAVEIHLVARDAIGQEGVSDVVRTVLPERIFNHPVARALVELRKELTVSPKDRLPVVRALNDLYQRPSHFFHDLVVALAIRSAERRLIHDRRPEAIAEVQDILWDTALRVEDGDLSIAERELRNIQEALMKALAEGASDDEIERLMQELEEALGRYLEALAEQMQQQLSQGQEPQPLPPNAQALESQELRDLIDQARELAKSGARDAARDLLAQLQEMLENLQTNPYAEMMDQQGQDAHEMMEDLNEMREQQQELLDRSYQRSQQGGEPQQGQEGREQQGESQSDSQAQEALRRELGEMMRRLGDALGDIPRPFGNAEQSMRGARDALERDEPGEAIAPQTRALDQLQQGMEAMAERFMQQMGENPGQGQGTVGMQPGQGRDPLGRETGVGGLEALEGVQIPDQMEIRRSREILRELRRRRGESSRPAPELDYIDRLLQQF